MRFETVPIKVRRPGQIYFIEDRGVGLEGGDFCVVRTERGVEIGEVLFCASCLKKRDDSGVRLLRKATGKDLAQFSKLQEEEKDAFQTGRQKIEFFELPMKLVRVEYTLDCARLTFYFTADNRVDFRDLVRELARIFRTRIEIRQIGVRDEARMLGGVGSCGRELCCCTFLTKFHPVSIRMAKRQNLALNPEKISGQCGRLKCCLRFEEGEYRSGGHFANTSFSLHRSDTPDSGSTPDSHDGEDSRTDKPGEEIFVARELSSPPKRK